MSERQEHARLVALALLAFALFNYPLLTVFDVPAVVLGVPVVWLYVFGAWALVIGLLGLAMKKR